MGESKMKNTLLITTRFFEYPKHIKKSIISEGYSCDHFYDSPILYRFFKQLKLGAILNIVYWYFITRFFLDGKYDKIILIRCEELPHSIIKRLKSYSDKVILYEWDSINNLTNAKKIINVSTDVYSFDYSDCNEFGFSYKSLFYIDAFYLDTETIRDIDVFFIGTWHGDRNKIIKSFREECVKSSVKFYSYLYLNPFLYLKLCILGREKPKLNEIKFRQLSKNKLVKMYHRSRSVLDIHSVTQSGLTMRTFEAIASGCKVITTNKNISFESNLDGMYIIIPREINEFDATKFFTLVSEKHSIPKSYSLKFWIVSLLK